MDIRSRVVVLFFSFGYLVTAYTPSGYLGCYADTSVRLLRDDKRVSFTNTGDECKTYCSARGFEYAGTEVGRECFCGHTMSQSTRTSGCDRPCPGNSNEMCGNHWRISVYETGFSTTTETTRSLTTARSTRTAVPDGETSSTSFSMKRSRATSVTTSATPTVNSSQFTANGGKKWKSWSGNRIFYLVRNVNFEFSKCKSFCELSVKSSLAVFWDTINPWFEESGILERGKRYWVQKKEPMLHGNQCHYLSALGYPRGLHCTEKYAKQDECKKGTSYKRLVLQSSPCTDGYGCICQRRI